MPLELSSGIFLSSTWNLIADLLGLSLLLAYHLRLSWVYRRHPERTTRGRADRLRRAWIEAVRARNGDILAIQTLRNWVMTASVFASTTIMIGLGLVAASFQELDMANLSNTGSFGTTACIRPRLEFCGNRFDTELCRRPCCKALGKRARLRKAADPGQRLVHQVQTWCFHRGLHRLNHRWRPAAVWKILGVPRGSGKGGGDGATVQSDRLMPVF